MTVDADALFRLGNLTALVGWTMLIFLPRRFAVVLAVPKFVIPGLLGLAYGALMLTFFFGSGGGYGSLDQVRALFSRDELLLAGWLHYLAFDLFVGVWIAEQADRAGIPRLIQAVFLLATFMFGPVGLVLYLLTRGMMSGLTARRPA